MSVVLEFVRQTVPTGWKSTPSGWISGNCPMCIQNGENADTRSRGGFFFDEGTFCSRVFTTSTQVKMGVECCNYSVF